MMTFWISLLRRKEYAYEERKDHNFAYFIITMLVFQSNETHLVVITDAVLFSLYRSTNLHPRMLG